MSGLDLGTLSVMVTRKRAFSTSMVHTLLQVALASRRTMPLWAADENSGSSLQTLRPRKGTLPGINTSKLSFDGIWTASRSQLKSCMKVYRATHWQILKACYGLRSKLLSGKLECMVSILPCLRVQ